MAIEQEVEVMPNHSPSPTAVGAGRSIVAVRAMSRRSKSFLRHAWGHLDGKHDERTRFAAVLEIPPVESAETAVRVQIIMDSRGKK
jgi:hypothetical protein